MEDVLAVVLVLAFALFWLALGVFLGVRLGERRLLRRMRNLPSTPSSAHLGNTVARSAGQQFREGRAAEP